MGRISGKITFKEPENAPAIAPGAVATIEVRDCARACGPSIKAGQVVIKNPTSFPLSYEMEYEDPKPDSYVEYALSCRIERDGKLEFINDTRFNINGANTLDIFVIKV
jgi:uncharacterized lipoprotein YbaY